MTPQILKTWYLLMVLLFLGGCGATHTVTLLPAHGESIGLKLRPGGAVELQPDMAEGTCTWLINERPTSVTLNLENSPSSEAIVRLRWMKDAGELVDDGWSDWWPEEGSADQVATLNKLIPKANLYQIRVWLAGSPSPVLKNVTLETEIKASPQGMSGGPRGFNKQNKGPGGMRL